LKVFISSVTHVLKDERNALPPFLRLFDYEPLRFEDFVSQDRSGREACLAGVGAADAYLLLLGPRYGDPFPDTGLAPTAEEFRLARKRGIPILVFNKTVDEPVEPQQQAFKDEVGHYVNGRLWKSFADPLSLNQAVGEALKALPKPGGPMELHPIEEQRTVPWLHATEFSPDLVSAPVLELHLLPIGRQGLAGAGALAETARALARDARLSGFVSDAEPLTVGSDNARAWAVRPPESSGDWHRKTVEAFRGLVATSAGEAAGFVSLTTDFLGALVNQTSLQQDLAQLIGLVLPNVFPGTDLAPAVAMSAAERVWEGDPGEVGPRSAGSLRSQSGLTIVLEPKFVVGAEDLRRTTGDVAAELAARIVNDVRRLPAF